MLFATHYLEEADQYADRIVLMRKGRIVADGTGSQIKALAAGRTVRATLDDPDHQALAAPGRASSRVEVRGDTVLLHAPDTDAVARYLLTQTDARDLEITARGIEEAFLSLTGDAADDPPDRRDRPARPEGTPDEQHDRPDHPPGAAAGRLQPHRPAASSSGGCSATGARSSSR